MSYLKSFSKLLLKESRIIDKQIMIQNNSPVYVGSSSHLSSSKSELKIKKEFYSYRRKRYLMTQAEQEFFQLLFEIYGEIYYVFPQVHLSTLFDHVVLGQDWKAALSHIARKSVDFVICDKLFQPLLAIELDDLTHKQEDRIERDMTVEQIFNKADLPLLRFENHGKFSKEEIQHLALEKLSNKPIIN